MPTIDLAFELVGTTIPLDHGYPLYSAVCRVVPALHGEKRVGVHPIRGRQFAPGRLDLVPGASRLRLRLPSEMVATYLPLAGARLDLSGHGLRVGIPRVEALVPAANLGARLVTIRGATEPAAFEAAVRRDLAELGLAAEPTFVPSSRPRWAGQPLRRIVRVKDKRIVGYALRVLGLTAEESLTLQEQGLGGRRRMGCGVFVPMKV